MYALKRFSAGRLKRPSKVAERNVNTESVADKAFFNNSPAPSQSPVNVEITLNQGLASLSIEEEILVAVVGITGSGKSSFIRRVTKRDDIEIGEGLCSMTQDVKEYKYTVQGKTFKLIDTPGFDDTEVDDEDIFESLVEWLEKSYRKGQRVTGLLYLHRIISNREKGSDLRNLRVFQKLCGDKSFSNVMIGITWWDQEDPEVADSREKVLKESDEFWGGMVKSGAQVVRMPLDEQGCTDLLLNLSRRNTTTLAVQDEIVNQGKSAKQTDAATALTNYDRLQAERDSEHLDQLAQDIRQKAQILRRQQEAAKRQAEERAKYEEEEERILAETEALLQQKRREAEAFRERTESRRKRMEELQKQLLEAEEHIQAAERRNDEPHIQQSPITTSPLTSSPTALNNQDQATPRKSSVPLSQTFPKPEQPNHPQNPERRFTLPRIEKLRVQEQQRMEEALRQETLEQERRKAELQRQISEQAAKQRAETERLARETREREAAAKLAAENLRKAEEERARLAEQGRIIQRTLRHQSSLYDWMRVFAQYQPLTNTWMRQAWRGLSYNIDGQNLAGPLQAAFCDFCMCHLPTPEGHYSCDDCLITTSSSIATCQTCAQTRSSICFSPSHNPVFKPWSDDFAHGPYFTCTRLRRRFDSSSLICSRCRDPLGVLFLHCCACDNDDFDVCIKCWGERLLRCNGATHTLYLHAWTPPGEKIFVPGVY